MKPFELRLAQNHAQNRRHLDNLAAFVDNNPKFEQLPDEDQQLMIEQVDALARLDNVLERRMIRLNLPV